MGKVENLEHFSTNYTDFMVELKEKLLYVGRKSVMSEEKIKNSQLVNFFFLSDIILAYRRIRHT